MGGDGLVVGCAVWSVVAPAVLWCPGRASLWLCCQSPRRWRSHVGALICGDLMAVFRRHGTVIPRHMLFSSAVVERPAVERPAVVRLLPQSHLRRSRSVYTSSGRTLPRDILTPRSLICLWIRLFRQSLRRAEPTALQPLPQPEAVAKGVARAPRILFNPPLWRQTAAPGEFQEARARSARGRSSRSA